jgi:hypothetical protein
MQEKPAANNPVSQSDVYVAGIGHFLPGDPIPVDSIDKILGEITKAPANGNNNPFVAFSRIPDDILTHQSVKYGPNCEPESRFPDTESRWT